ncbi:MAG: ATP-grasp domain-containing protein [[Eubacterium] brachy]|nr:ATP-grasp domain-containing protein [[Eubacterium] brachy]
MKFKNRGFIPVLLGGDINTYSMARAFYEAYEVKSYVFGKFPNGPSYKSKITVYEANKNIDRDDYFLSRINDFADDHKDEKIILIGCGDSYVNLISRYKSRLKKNIIAPYIDFELMDMLQKKEEFYKLCEKHGVDYPKTLIYEREMGRNLDVEFEFPVILKPSDSIMYWEYPFEEQKKVFFIDSEKELFETVEKIYDAGYHSTMIIQDTVPGNDENMRVLTSYSDRNGKVKMMCLGHVFLEEHTPKGIGNHAVIVTEPNRELMKRVKELLEDLCYVGFSNFDIKFDRRDGKYKFFEINTRQGRSNYYVTFSGFNLAKYIVEDYIENKEIAYGEAEEEFLWMTVPKNVALENITSDVNRAKVKDLISEGRVVNPIFKKGDFNIERWMRMMKNHLRQKGNFRTYYKNKNGV